MEKPTEPKANLAKKLKLYRISESELGLIRNLLGREPEGLEWALFSALWSEHCSYKSSRKHLKKFAATVNETVVNFEGENAGVVDLGQGERIAFKMESHNHPSFIEPYQGAATGVGGILRDIFTMGARPIALANYLCFGEQKSDRWQMLMDGVVRGIGGYGNCVGVPNITGSTEFDKSYNQNNLVNAMAVGYLGSNQKVALSQAHGIGNRVVYVGAKTGKDGVHGASMASESFGENNEAKKPNVQIGDPFYEKLLIESCLEVLDQDLVVAIQDMGAAGLTSSTFEMSAKGDVGMRLQLDQVPLRDSTMTPEEIMLSESQERMLMVVKPENVEKLQQVFHRWNMEASDIGEITEKDVELFWGESLVCRIDAKLLVDHAPLYSRAFEPWAHPRRREKIETPPHDLSTHLDAYFSNYAHHSKKNIYRQYDQRVGLRTARGCENTIGMVRLPESGRGLAVTVGCRPWIMRIDARIGALDAIIEPSLRMALKGARAISVTDCLNFGNPEKTELMSEFVASVDALVEASRWLSAPVVSGNVSFYNETNGQNITSTPATGVIGLRDSVLNIPKDSYQKAGAKVYCVEMPLVHLSQDLFSGDIDASVANFVRHCLELSKASGVLSTRLAGAGGLGVALIRHGLQDGRLGFELDSKVSAENLKEQILYQTIFEVEEDRGDGFAALCQSLDQKFFYLGKVTEKEEFHFGAVMKQKSDVQAQWSSGFEFLR